MSAVRRGELDRLLAGKEIVIACGAGGVGKTTTAAALAATAAVRSPIRVLVVTVDPARRLADALGVQGIGNTATRVPDDALIAAGAKPRGELWAAMLDTKSAWDGLITHQAPNRTVAAEILSNPIYQSITGRFVRSHEYIAMERLYELYTEGTYDLIIVDTPPSLGALDFLDAPERMAEFFSSRLLRLLTTPARSRLIGLASRPFYQVADRILGTQLLEDMARFFIVLESMYPGFVDRARAVAQLLRAERTTFLVVTSADAVPVREARSFLDALKQRRMHLGLLVANKVLPPSFADSDALALSEELPGRAGELADALHRQDEKHFPDVARLSRVLSEIAMSYRNYGAVANREEQQLAELSASVERTLRVPHLMHEVDDLEGLLEIGAHLFSSKGSTSE